jgi:SLT domain-containing protein
MVLQYYNAFGRNDSLSRPLSGLLIRSRQFQARNHSLSTSRSDNLWVGHLRIQKLEHHRKVLIPKGKRRRQRAKEAEHNDESNRGRENIASLRTSLPSLELSRKTTMWVAAAD